MYSWYYEHTSLYMGFTTIEGVQLRLWRAGSMLFGLIYWRSFTLFQLRGFALGSRTGSTRTPLIPVPATFSSVRDKRNGVTTVPAGRTSTSSRETVFSNASSLPVEDKPRPGPRSLRPRLQILPLSVSLRAQTRESMPSEIFFKTM